MNENLKLLLQGLLGQLVGSRFDLLTLIDQEQGEHRISDEDNTKALGISKALGELSGLMSDSFPELDQETNDWDYENMSSLEVFCFLRRAMDYMREQVGPVEYWVDPEYRDAYYILAEKKAEVWRGICG